MNLNKAIEAALTKLCLCLLAYETTAMQSLVQRSKRDVLREELNQ